MPTMSRQVRDVFALAALIAGYGILLWVYESKLASQWGESYAIEPKAIFARDHDRDRLIAEEMDIGVPTFTPPADDLPVMTLEDVTDGSD